jgi:DnaJ-class molecular chaperone
MSTYQERKKARREHYAKFVHGWKQIPCSACSGSGRYDHNGSPPCGACDGTGKERVSPQQYAEWEAWEAEKAARNAKIRP